MVAITIMASADSVGWAKARNAPCPRGFMQVIPRPPPLQDGSDDIIISDRGHGARSRAWTDLQICLGVRLCPSYDSSAHPIGDRTSYASVVPSVTMTALPPMDAETSRPAATSAVRRIRLGRPIS